MSLSRLFIAKNRKVDFELTVLIQDLTNVPLVSGLYFIKWKLKNTDHSSGSTGRAPIRDHNIFWGHAIYTTAHLIISKHHVLGSCELKLEIFQELGGSKESMMIGTLTINLSEYANSGFTTRRYLLNDCKFNSTIKLSIKLEQMSITTTEFNIPPLKKQQLFTDIPSMITDRNDRSSLFDEKSLRGSGSKHPDMNMSDLSLKTPASSIRKAKSAVSVPYYCREVSPFFETDDPSPNDLIDQLFKANNIPTSS